ncbi:MAG: bifunctional phosphoribosylaminoimidazolecarboxamide formyltransferase/IMP cyclohydrolase [Planctomycetes bacterium]|nr:bifunctional phosphoribosylaminoimidazolecarboxamide formyltransferase/IMP cyclohydrolase [Planctomycetota bacterium]
MPPRKPQRALISVYDKTGIVEFARALVDEFGIEIISTGGTAALLKQEGIPVTLVEQVTGFPEMLDGRVKTLHPKIHAAILADRDNPEHMRQLAPQGIKPIDMVVVNLYPFAETVADPACTFEEAIEMIDIGGPCLLRAAAKNHRHVLVVYAPERYSEALLALRGERDREHVHVRFAAGAFEVTTGYDAEVSTWLGKRGSSSSVPYLTAFFTSNRGPLRYGENPHQSAWLLRSKDDSGGIDLTIADHDAEPSQKGRSSFNNYADAAAAVALAGDLVRAPARPRAESVFSIAAVGAPGEAVGYTAVFIKHTNPCGVGVAGDPLEAYRRAYLGDPHAAMGGILSVSFAVDDAIAEGVMDSLGRWGKAAGASAFFTEVWIAPKFSEGARAVIATRKTWGPRTRLLELDLNAGTARDAMDLRSIPGGYLLQTLDTLAINEDQWKVVTRRTPTESEMSDLKLAWLIAKHTKSNSISICKDGMLIGNGAGQMSRVMSCRIATWLANENGHADKLPGSVAASDAFFPFADGPNILVDAGVTALIQPGGSKRDEETIRACDERNVAMIFTGTRHFRH